MGWLDLRQVRAAVLGHTVLGPPWGVLLELVWARDLQLIGVALARWLEHLDPAPVCAIKIESEHKEWHLLASTILDRVLIDPRPLADTLGFVNGFLSLTI